MHFQRITSVQIFKKEESNIKNSEKTSATVYGGTAGKSKSTSPKDIETEVQAAFEAVRAKHGIPSTPSTPATAEQGSLWNPTRAIGTGPIKPTSSVSVTGTQTGADIGGQSAADAAEQTKSTTKPRSANFFDLTLNSLSRGYYDSRLNQEAWKAMQGRDNKMEKYTEILNSDKYNFEADKCWQKGISGAAEQVGQWTRQITDPETLALTAGLGGVALLAGQIGPLVALPDEVFTLPSALSRGLKVGVAKAGMEIEAGRAYLEMLDHGISEETAALLATGVGAVNGVLDTVQLDELMDAYRILDKVGADDATRSVILQEINKRLKDVFMEAGQETLQEGVSIAGTQIGSKVDTGAWAYTGREAADRLEDAATSAVLTYGLTNALPAAHNIHARNRNQLSALGEKKLRAGEMPTPRELEAMNLSESEALGRMVLFQMEEPEDSWKSQQTRDPVTPIFSEGNDKKQTDTIEVEFQCHLKYDETEFARQLAAQQSGMNELTVQEFLINRQRFLEHGRAIESGVAQQAAREQALVDKRTKLRNAGLSLMEAEEQALKWLDTQAALHNPDQVAGGYAHNVSGVGDKNINSSIGAQWRYRINAVDEQLRRITEGMSEEEKLSTYLNIYLTYKGD